MPADRAHKPNWLREFMIKTVRDGKFCNDLNCTTCGNLVFRDGVLAEYAKSIGRESPVIRDGPRSWDAFFQAYRDFGEGILEALVRIRPAGWEDSSLLHDPVRAVLNDTCRVLGEQRGVSGSFRDSRLNRLAGVHRVGAAS